MRLGSYDLCDTDVIKIWHKESSPLFVKPDIGAGSLMVLNRTDFATFARKRDSLLKIHPAAPQNAVDRWKMAWQRELSQLPYLSKVSTVPPTGRRQQVSILCAARFMRLNLSIAQSDMEKFFAQHAAGSKDTSYAILTYPQRIEMHFAELNEADQVVSGLVTISSSQTQ